MYLTQSHQMLHNLTLLVEGLATWLTICLFFWKRGHVYVFQIYRGWYYFSTVVSVMLLVYHAWVWVVDTVRQTHLRRYTLLALDLAWTLLWIIHLGMESLVYHGTGYPTDVVHLILSLQVCKCALCLPAFLMVSTDQLTRWGTTGQQEGDILASLVPLRPTPSVSHQTE